MWVVRKKGWMAVISEMLQKENIRILDEIPDWETAIRVSLDPLEKGGFVEERYAEEIIRSTKEIGPYYVLTDDIALIHGRPEQGVLKKQLAITVVRKPVIFSGSDYPVRILLALAATDSNSHVDVMQVLAAIFLDEEKIRRVAEAGTPEEIYEFFIEEEKNGGKSSC